MAKKKKDAQIEYLWKGKNKNNNLIKGQILALNANMARAQLIKQGIQLTRLKKKPKSIFGLQRIKSGDISVFSRQMATMMQAGVPMIQSLEIIINGTEHSGVKRMVSGIKAKIEEGSSFSESLKIYPKYFDQLFYSLIYAGEQSGTLDTMLGRIATYKEKIESIKKKIKKALFYPSAVLLTAFVVTAILLVFVVPTFEDLFSSFGAELPLFTRMVIDLSVFMQAYWWAVLIAIIIFVICFLQAKRRSLKFREIFDKFLLRIPIIGPILNKSCVARFSRTLSTTFAAGMPLVEALVSVSGATGNLTYEYATLRIKDEIASGINLQTATNNTGQFPAIVVQMIAIGEESGQLDHMLAKVADIYEEEVDLAVDSLSSLLEPLIMVVLGVLVGGLVVAMYLPIFEMGTVL